MKPTWRGALVILPCLLFSCSDDRVATKPSNLAAPGLGVNHGTRIDAGCACAQLR